MKYFKVQPAITDHGYVILDKFGYCVDFADTFDDAWKLRGRHEAARDATRNPSAFPGLTWLKEER